MWLGLSLSFRGERLLPPFPTPVCAYFSLFLVGFPQLEGARASGGQSGVGVGPAVPSKQAEARGDQGPEEKPCKGGSGQGQAVAKVWTGRAAGSEAGGRWPCWWQQAAGCAWVAARRGGGRKRAS